MEKIITIKNPIRKMMNGFDLNTGEFDEKTLKQIESYAFGPKLAQKIITRNVTSIILELIYKRELQRSKNKQSKKTSKPDGKKRDNPLLVED